MNNQGTIVSLQLCQCSRMDEIRPGLRNEIAGRRGMLAKVVSGGFVRRGNSIILMEETV
jgi:MOSC domain-containing protein YiiM